MHRAGDPPAAGLVNGTVPPGPASPASPAEAVPLRPGSAAGRVFLFLQGPSSGFFARVGRELLAAGATVRRINLCPGDALYWHLPGATSYRGRPADWPASLDAYLRRHGVTDLVLLGDSRPYHAPAVEAARTSGLRVHLVELGVLRPDWLTVEPDGMASFSRFPRDPDTIRRLAEGGSLPEPGRRYRSTFFEYAVLDVAWNVVNVVFGFLYPHFRSHAVDHPVREYAGWIGKLVRARFQAARWRRELDAVLALEGPLFVMPLQLLSDYQLRVHAPEADLRAVVARIVASFAAHAPAAAHLAFKTHPLDNGWTPWRRILAEAAARHGVGARCHLVEDGDLDRLLARAVGLVTVNSTVGLTALRAGVPVLTLGNALYDVPGLTDQRPLDAFWTGPMPPDLALRDSFLRALVATTQVRGAFDGEGAAPGARAVAARLVEPERLPGPSRPRVPVFRRGPDGGLLSESPPLWSEPDEAANREPEGVRPQPP